MTCFLTQQFLEKFIFSDTKPLLVRMNFNYVVMRKHVSNLCETHFDCRSVPFVHMSTMLSVIYLLFMLVISWINAFRQKMIETLLNLYLVKLGRRLRLQQSKHTFGHEFIYRFGYHLQRYLSCNSTLFNCHRSVFKQTTMKSIPGMASITYQVNFFDTFWPFITEDVERKLSIKIYETYFRFSLNLFGQCLCVSFWREFLNRNSWKSNHLSTIFTFIWLIKVQILKMVAHVDSNGSV